MLKSSIAALLSWALIVALPIAGRAEMASLLAGSALQTPRHAIVQADTSTHTPDKNVGIGSLFAGKGGLGLFAPHPKRISESAYNASLNLATALGGDMSPSARILDLISKAEAGSKGYDAVQHGARRLPQKQPTQMTIAQIYQWIEQTPGQPHAIGRYQFIPETLKRLVSETGLSPNEIFSPRTQDILAEKLLIEAGITAVSQGRMTRRTFMNNLARIWAGLPNSTGKSHYHGYAGNRATMTWAKFESEMRNIFPS